MPQNINFRDGTTGKTYSMPWSDTTRDPTDDEMDNFIRNSELPPPQQKEDYDDFFSATGGSSTTSPPNISPLGSVGKIIAEQTGRFGRGVADVTTTPLMESGRRSSQQLMSGDVMGAFDTVTKPFNFGQEALYNKVYGPPTTGQQDIEQVLGSVGAPVDAFKEAYKESDYSRMMGQGAGVTSMFFGPKYARQAIRAGGEWGRNRTKPYDGPFVDTELVREQPQLAHVPPAQLTESTGPRFYQGREGVADTTTPYKMDTGPTNINRTDLEYGLNEKGDGLSVTGGQPVSPQIRGFIPGQSGYAPARGETATMLPQDFGQLNPVPPMMAAESGTTLGKPLSLPPIAPIENPMENRGQPLSRTDLLNAEIIKKQLNDRRSERLYNTPPPVPPVVPERNSQIEKDPNVELVSKNEIKEAFGVPTNVAVDKGWAVLTKKGYAITKQGSTVLRNMKSSEDIEPKAMRVFGSAPNKKLTPDQITQLEEAQKLDYKQKITGQENNNVSQLLRKFGYGSVDLDNISMGGMSERNLDVAGTALYSESGPNVAMKELAQNSFDEHRIIGQTKSPRVFFNDYDVLPDGTQQKSITIRDFGRGMTPNQLYNQFTDVGETGKANEVNASGGFGFAKAAPMLGGTYFRAQSMVREGGKVFKYTFEGNPKNLKKQEIGVSTTREEMPKNTPTGMRITTFFDNDKYLYDARDLLKKLTEESFSLTSNADFLDNYHFAKDEIEDWLEDKKDPHIGNRIFKAHGKTFQTGTKPKLQDTITIPGAKVDFYYDDPVKGSQQSHYDIIYLNKGLYSLSSDGNSYGMGAMANVPGKIVVDILATVEEGETGYPFTANREQLDKPLKKAIQKWIDDNVISGALTKKKKQLQDLYDGMIDLKTSGTRKGSFYDPGDRLTPDELNHIKNNPLVKDLVNLFDSVIDDIFHFTGRKNWASQLEGVGIIFEPALHGIRIKNPTTGKMTVLINLFEFMKKYGITDAAFENITTLLHETAHVGDEYSGLDVKVDPTELKNPRTAKYWHAYLREVQDGGINPGHEMPFTKRLGEIYVKFGTDNAWDAADKLEHILTNGTGNYTQQLQDLLQIYNDSRGRPEVTEDILSGTGVKSENKGPGGPGSVPPDSKSGGERTTGGESKLGNVKPFPQKTLPPVSPLNIPSFLEGKGKDVRSFLEGGGTVQKLPPGSAAGAENSWPQRVSSPLANRFGKNSNTPGRAQGSDPMRWDLGRHYTGEDHIRRTLDTVISASANQLERAKALGIENPEKMNESQRSQAIYEKTHGIVKQAISELPPEQQKEVKDSIVEMFNRLLNALGDETGAVGPDISGYRRPKGSKRGPSVSMKIGANNLPRRIRVEHSKGKEALLEIGNFSRSMMSSVDMSAPFRQAAPMIGEGVFWKTMGPMAISFFNEKYHDKMMKAIEDHPDFKLAVSAKLPFTDMDHLTTREEKFKSVWAERVGALDFFSDEMKKRHPWLDKTHIPRRHSFVRMSGRAYTGYLNTLRMAMFTKLLDSSAKSGVDLREIIRKVETDEKLTNKDRKKALEPVTLLARLAGEVTGRGYLGDALEPAAELLNIGFFSPRLMASRVKLLNPYTYVNPKISWTARKQYFKSLASLVAAGLIVYAGAKALGGEPELNIESSDFGKFRFGKNSRAEIVPGGFAQYIRTAFLLASVTSHTVAGMPTTYKKSPITGRRTELNTGRYGAPTGLDEAYSFMEKKEAPNLSLISDMWRGADFRNQKIGPDSFKSLNPGVNPLLGRVLPISGVDTAEMMQGEKPKYWPGMVPAYMGWGVQTFGEQPFQKPNKGTERGIRKYR